jgi:hypothetical protein
VVVGDDDAEVPRNLYGFFSYFYIWEYFASCSFRSGMGMNFFVESCLWA